jgi:hypothetical protein
LEKKGEKKSKSQKQLCFLDYLPYFPWDFFSFSLGFGG